jgi:hypothetical protein
MEKTSVEIFFPITTCVVDNGIAPAGVANMFAIFEKMPLMG